MQKVQQKQELNSNFKPDDIIALQVYWYTTTTATQGKNSERKNINKILEMCINNLAAAEHQRENE
mgnify:CR=1 FL=1